MILMIYNKKLCREFLLPNLHNSDYQIILPQKLYGLSGDLALRLEAGAGWMIHGTEEYQVKSEGLFREHCTLKGQDILEICTLDGHSLIMIVADTGISMHAAKKYDLSAMKQVTIGKSDGSLIQYDFRGMVSSCHAELARHSDGWYLADRSTNGVFHRNGRVQGNYKLKFGEHLDIFGLHLVYFGDTLAVGTYVGNLAVNEGILRKKPIAGQPAANEGQNMGSDVALVRKFNRSPRNLPSIYTESLEIEGPPAPREMKQRPWFMVVGPSFTMAIPMLLGCGIAIWGSSMRGMASSAFMYTGLITAVGSAALGAFWAVTNLRYSRTEQMEDEEHRFNAYSNYLIKITEELRQKYDYNANALKELYPSARACTKYNACTPQLWNRNQTHGDFLFHRAGIGEMPFQMSVKVPQEKFTLLNDTLLEKPEMIYEQFRTLNQVPVGISLLEKRLIGLVGGEGKQGAVEIMHSVVAGIAASHCYTDVKFVFIYDEQDTEKKKEWECMRWFPHVWSQDHQTRYMAADEVEKRDILFELSNVLRARVQGMDAAVKNGIPKPYYILFVSDPCLLEGELLTRYIYEPAPEYGLTAFLMVEHIEQLPNECEDIIENDSFYHGFYNLLEGAKGKNAVQLDKVSGSGLEQMGRTLANIKVNEIESTSEIPAGIDFLSMYGVNKPEELDVEERWRKNRTYNSMKALIGKKSGNVDCFLDVHEKYHGPHGLVAGTTGSGKSETLQTYILSLALNFSPEDVALFIIDFKGGGMANLFSNLPHMAGQISNLSGNQIHRAMISIKSENLRRQRIFSEYGVNNINLYTRLYKNHESEIPIPHLFIIIDEFAELKREEPDFMRELISVAQVGRSLGVHLILATQKPSGTVDDNIWSNSRFRLCLRVQDRQDSSDMLHKPDAAFITQTGRGYLQVGNDEIYELFQSGFSGAPYDTDGGERNTSVTMLTRTGKTALIGKRARRQKQEKKAVQGTAQGKDRVQEVTQLKVVAEYLRAVALKNGYGDTRQLWMPVLKDTIFLKDAIRQYGDMEEMWGAAAQPEDKKGAQWALKAVIGVYDDPENQKQRLLEADFAENGNLAVCGGAVSGKSTFLQTLMYSLLTSYTPDRLQCYFLDFSSHMLAPFEKAAQTGGIVYDSQEDRLGKFMHMLAGMMDERKARFEGGNYSQYVQVHGPVIPAILIVVDNFGGFREKSGGRYDDVMARLVREGAGYGMYLAVSAAGFGIAEIPNRIADNIRMVFSLEQSDRYKYMEIMRVTKLTVLPEPGIKGRGLANIDGRVLEFQAALSIEAEDDFTRGQLLEQIFEEKARSWKGARPRSIPEIPVNPTLGQLEALTEYQSMAAGGDCIPMAYEKQTAAVFGISLKNTYCYVISGRAHTGKTNTLKMLIYGAQATGGKLYVIEPGQAELRKTAQGTGAQYLTELEEIFAYFKDLTPIFITRNKKKKRLIEEGLDETEIYRQMKQEEPIFIFLSDLYTFFTMVYQADAKVGNMSGFMENIMEKGSLHGIYFFGCLQADDAGKLISYRAYQHFTAYKRGVHLGGNLSSQKIFNFQNIPYAELSKTMKKGGGYAADEEDETYGIQIAIPLARRD